MLFLVIVNIKEYQTRYPGVPFILVSISVCVCVCVFFWGDGERERERGGGEKCAMYLLDYTSRGIPLLRILYHGSMMIVLVTRGWYSTKGVFLHSQPTSLFLDTGCYNIGRLSSRISLVLSIVVLKCWLSALGDWKFGIYLVFTSLAQSSQTKVSLTWRAFFWQGFIAHSTFT